jgi:uncharacterized membrane protein YphA (DoxX/SURF4 family)
MQEFYLIGRILLGGYFIYSGIGHFMGLTAMAGYAKSKHIPAPTLSVALSGLMLLLGGLSILLNFWMVTGVLILEVFLIVATLTMHQFWTIKDPMARMSETIGFSKNVALIGSLLMIASK